MHHNAMMKVTIREKKGTENGREISPSGQVTVHSTDVRSDIVCVVGTEW